MLAVEALRAGGARDVELLALSQLIGAVGTLVARRRGITALGDRTPMVSVTHADPERIAELGAAAKAAGMARPSSTRLRGMW